MRASVVKLTMIRQSPFYSTSCVEHDPRLQRARCPFITAGFFIAFLHTYILSLNICIQKYAVFETNRLHANELTKRKILSITWL